MSVKDYKEGMIAGAKPFEEKFREIQNANIAAIQKLCCENSNSIGELIDISEEHDNLLNYDWKKNCELSSFAEKAIFLGFLKFCIRVIEGENLPSDCQKVFFNNLCKTFQIDPFQIKEIDITKLKNNEDISFQNLLFMSLCNYFYIADENFKVEKKYDQEIFQYFRVSRNDRNEIHELIEWTNNHLDLESIFDFEEEQNNVLQETDDSIGCSTLDKQDDFFTIQEVFFVKSEEDTSICNKRIHFEANLKIDGKLLFKNCYIQYGVNDSVITVNDNGEVTFENCTFDYSNNSKDYFIKSSGKLSFNNCLFINCWGLCEASKITINKSNIIYNNSFNFEKDSNDCLYLFNRDVCISDSYVSGGVIIFSKKINTFDKFYIFDTIIDCKGCVFNECISPAANWTGTVINSHFSKCINIFENHWSSFNYSIQETEFNYCESIFNIQYGSNLNVIEGCKFNDCSNCLIAMKSSKLSIKNCEFRNLLQYKNPSSYILITEPKNTDLLIQNTIFDNLTFTNFGYLIKIQGTMTEKEHCKIIVSDCMFGKVYRKTPNPIIDSHVICVSYFVSKQSSKNVLLSSNNTGIDDLLKQIDSQYNDKKINELEAIVNEYLPSFGFTRYSKKEILNNKKAAKKFSTIKKIIPNLDEENVLGFADLTLTGSANEYLVFTNVQCYYHSSDRVWTYFYNHPELSSGYPIVIDDGKKRIFSLDEITVKNKDFGECITKFEAVLKESK